MSKNALDELFINTQQNNKNVEYAGFWIRLLASIIDSFVLVPLVLVSLYNILSLKSIPLMIIISLLSTIYKPLLEWKYGATAGKMLVKVKVVNENFRNISLEQAIGRYIPWLITQILSLITSFYMFSATGFAEVKDIEDLDNIAQNLPLDTVSTVYNFIFIFLVGSLIIDKRKQGVHDKIARTICIKKDK